jgi:hypothetical protein
MNPFKAHFYVKYLELFEFGTPLSIRMFDIELYDLELPKKIRKMAYEAKYKARYHTNRINELKLMYALQYTDGYKVKANKVDEFCYYESLDPLKDIVAKENLGLFSQTGSKKRLSLLSQ